MTTFLSKLSYASASFSAALLLQYYQSKAQFFYVVEMKLSPNLYALAIAIWAIYNAINDPLAGWIMDRKVTRWGRRLPWMIAFWIPLVLGFALIWTPPQNTSQFNVFIWLLLVLLLFDTGYTVVILAWAALFPELYTSTEERSTVSALRQFFSLIALVLALVLPPSFVKDGDLTSYASFGWILATISFVNIGMSFYGSREVKFKEADIDNEYSLKEGIAIVFNNKNYQAFLIVNLITYFAYGQVLALLPFYRKFIIKKEETFETMAYGVTILVTLFALVYWVKHVNKKSAKSAYIYAASIFSIALIPLWFLSDINQLLIIFALMGIGLSGLLLVIDILLSEIIDEDFKENGKRREGIFFGFNGFFIRIAILMQAGSLAIISYFTGFDNEANVQTDLGNTGIKIQMLLLPIICLLFSIIIINKYYNIEETSS